VKKAVIEKIARIEAEDENRKRNVKMEESRVVDEGRGRGRKRDALLMLTERGCCGCCAQREGTFAHLPAV
jgi:hypothetical protein